VTRPLRQRRFIGGVGGRPRLGKRVAEHVHPEGLRRLRQENLAARERLDNHPGGVAALHGVGGRKGGNRRPELDGRVDGSGDDVRTDERACGIVNDHHVRAA
jgi:hypothetical protein